MSPALAVVVSLAAATALVLVVQFLVRPRLGRRGRLATDALLGDRAAERQWRRATSHAVLRRLYPGLSVPGGPLLHRKASRHLAVLGRTVVVRAAPDVVEPVVRGVVAASPQFESTPAAPDETTAWRLCGSVVGALPRMSVRSSTAVPGSVEIGVTAYGWALGFPQGGPAVAEFDAALVRALQQARLPWRRYLRRFAPADGVRTDLGRRDGVWHVDALLAADATPDAPLERPAS